MTEAEREVYDSLLQSIYDQIVAAMDAGRGDKLKSSVQETIDAGPYFLASDALAAGLVDKIIYEDELKDILKDEFSFSGTQSCVPEYINYKWSQPREPHRGYLCPGNIVMGEGEPGSVIAHENTVKLIREARKNPMYKGIILRVDSGGGSGQASDIILRELQLAQAENKKYGGIHVRHGGFRRLLHRLRADRIVAQPSTLAGSIGVMGLTFALPRLYDKIGVNWSTMQRRQCRFRATHRYWTEEEKSRMSDFIEAYYEDFMESGQGTRRPGLRPGARHRPGARLDWRTGFEERTG